MIFRESSGTVSPALICTTRSAARVAKRCRATPSRRSDRSRRSRSIRIIAVCVEVFDQRVIADDELTRRAQPMRSHLMVPYEV